MASRGVHFAIDEETVQRLEVAKDHAALVEIASDEVEESWDMAFEADKEWDARHRWYSKGTFAQHTWSFQGSPDFFRAAADADESIVFKAAQ